MRLNIAHRTEYRFDAAPAYGLQQIRLWPQSLSAQQVLSWDLTVEGATTEAVFADHHGNTVHLVSLDTDVTHLSIVSHGTVQSEDRAGVIGPHRGFTPLWLYRRQTPLTAVGAGVRALSQATRDAPGSDLDRLHALSASIAGRVRYETGRTDARTSAEDALAAGVGVCQDHSHVFIAAARAAGYPARYVSGYLMMDDRVEQDATHAWAEAHVEGLGWTGFDVSNGISPDSRYVRVAVGLDYSDAAPIGGITLGGQSESIHVQVQVQQ